MKITVRQNPDIDGNVLFVALILALVMGLTLGSYLTLIAGQEQSVSRSQRWNSAIDVAEAGIEEGLAQVNASPVDFSLNGWTASGSTYGPQIRTLTNGSYSVIIQGGTTPTIYATGTVTAPITGTKIQRTVRVTTTVIPLFNVALGAVGSINMNGNSMATDSWNSLSNNLSNNGVYTSTKVSTNGDVASQQGIVNVGNHTIDGNLYLGPAATYISSTNDVMGTIDKNYNVNFPDVVLPSSAATALPAPVIGGNYVLSANIAYYINGGMGNKPIVVSAGLTNVTLFVYIENFTPSSIDLMGGMTNAATLTLYDAPPSAGGTATMASGNNTGGAIGARPINFIFYGTANLASIDMSGTSQFIGAIYAPQSTLALDGGGGAPNVQGAIIVGNASLNGHYDVHYDEALAQFGPAKGFVANSWQEL